MTYVMLLITITIMENCPTVQQGQIQGYSLVFPKIPNCSVNSYVYMYVYTKWAERLFFWLLWARMHDISRILAQNSQKNRPFVLPSKLPPSQAGPLNHPFLTWCPAKWSHGRDPGGPD